MSTQTATAAKITYRKTGKGEWVAYGPASAIKAGEYADISKRNGGTDRMMVKSVGRPFAVAGVQMVYGYLGSGATVSGPLSAGFASHSDAREYRGNRSAYSRRRCETGGNCSSFGSGRSCGAPDCDGY